MANSLLTGISGLRGHQKMLEVIGNNLANVNTTAFKTARTLFSDLMYESQRGASSGSSDSGALGSINPLQVGTGSELAQVDLNFTQGNLEATNQSTDVAIDGGGFFVALGASGAQVFTRAGAFTLDENGYLEDPSTGYLIQRFGTVGESTVDGPAFQVQGDNRIQVPIGASIPGTATTQIEFSGQLGASATGPIRRLIEGVSLTASGAPATGTTLLNDLDTTTSPYGPGDSLEFIGQMSDQSSFFNSLSVDATTTVQDLIDHINTTFGTDATASLVGSSIQIETTATGPTFTSLRVDDTATNAGESNAAFTAQYSTLEPGADASLVRGTVPIFDERGAELPLAYELQKQVDGSWNMTFTLESGGSLIDNVVTGIRFGPNGALTQDSGSGTGDNRISVVFDNSTVPREIALDLGTLGEVDGLAEIGTSAEISFQTDGAGPGELASVQIDVEGTIAGIASNGMRFPLAQLAIASFRNPDGLQLSGGNYYTQSLASGPAQVGTALSGDRGAVRAGQLEGSNVDLALEFTRLIVAQRGFSANARTITVTDEVLEELTNIIR